MTAAKSQASQAGHVGKPQATMLQGRYDA